MFDLLIERLKGIATEEQGTFICKEIAIEKEQNEDQKDE